MNDTGFIITIIKRSLHRQYLDFYERKNVKCLYYCLCKGTAKQKTLDYFGLEPTDKVIIFSMIKKELVQDFFKALINEMGITALGNGISVSIPINSIGGVTAYNYLTYGQNEVNGMNNDEIINKEIAHSLIIAICEKGYSDDVMDAARKVNASGGTVLHAKGTGAQFSEKFFGLSIAAEKDIVLIVSSNDDKSKIMKKIMEEAGINSPAHTILFSLPVENVSGFNWKK